MTCPAMMWICWISGVASDGACRQMSQRRRISPPERPVSPTTASRLSRAASIARRMFGERPDVDNAKNTSPALPRASDLALEHPLETVIVADRGQDRAVGRQRQCRRRRAVVIEPRQQFAGDVLGVAGAAAIAGEQQLVAAGERICGDLDDRRHCVAESRVVERRLHDIARLLQIIEIASIALPSAAPPSCECPGGAVLGTPVVARFTTTRRGRC